MPRSSHERCIRLLEHLGPDGETTAREAMALTGYASVHSALTMLNTWSKRGWLTRVSVNRFRAGTVEPTPVRKRRSRVKRERKRSEYGKERRQSQSFRPDEIDVMAALLARASTSSDNGIRALFRSQGGPLIRLTRKFRSMRERVEVKRVTAGEVK